jgi:hypothetical protein
MANIQFQSSRRRPGPRSHSWVAGWIISESPEPTSEPFHLGYVAFLVSGVPVTLRATRPEFRCEQRDPLSAQLRARRLSLGLTIAEAAALVGVDVRNVGERPPAAIRPKSASHGDVLGTHAVALTLGRASARGRATPKFSVCSGRRIRLLPSWCGVDHCIAPPAAERTWRSSKATQSPRLSKRRCVRRDCLPARRMPPSTRGESYVPDGSIDVGSLEGDALTRWYLRSPADIEQERQAAAAKRYPDFFYGASGTGPDPGFAREIPSMDHDVDPGFAVSLPSTSRDIDPGFTWVPVGPNRLRSVRLASDDQSAGPLSLAPMSYGGVAAAGEPTP